MIGTANFIYHLKFGNSLTESECLLHSCVEDITNFIMDISVLGFYTEEKCTMKWLGLFDHSCTVKSV